jgi:CDP-diacylglycerol--glycerol-3-phosphate 3-phosphatidyltransferase
LVGSWAAYAERWSTLHGGYDPRRASFFVRGWLFLAYLTAKALSRLPVGPDAVTASGLLLSAGVPLLAWPGGAWPAAAAVLVLASSLADTVDGALALITGRASRLGRVYDSVADRVSEACWVIALVLAGAPVWLAVGCGALAWLHEYVRARATVAGMAEIGVVTVGERPTRIIVLVFGLMLTGIVTVADASLTGDAATLTTAIWSVLGVVAFIQLAVAVRRALH